MTQKILLNDPLTEPEKSAVESVLGEKTHVYEKLVNLLNERGYETIWRYYNDSKAWLCKVAKGKKTICWLSIWDVGIKLSFFFTEKNFPKGKKFYGAEDVKPAGKLWPVVILLKDDKHLDEIVELMGIKDVK